MWGLIALGQMLVESVKKSIGRERAEQYAKEQERLRFERSEQMKKTARDSYFERYQKYCDTRRKR